MIGYPGFTRLRDTLLGGMGVIASEEFCIPYTNYRTL